MPIRFPENRQGQLRSFTSHKQDGQPAYQGMASGLSAILAAKAGEALAQAVHEIVSTFKRDARQFFANQSADERDSGTIESAFYGALLDLPDDVRRNSDWLVLPVVRLLFEHLHEHFDSRTYPDVLAALSMTAKAQQRGDKLPRGAFGQWVADAEARYIASQEQDEPEQTEVA